MSFKLRHQILFLSCLGLLAGCNSAGSNPFGSSAGGAGGGGPLQTYVLWKNGVLQPAPTTTWYGATLQLQTQPVGGVNPVAANDNITGDTNAMQGSYVPTLGAPALALVICPLGPVGGPGCGVNASNYVNAGHISFDIRLEPLVAPATLSYIEVEFGAYGGCIYDYHAIDLNTLNTATFTAVSIPMNQFTYDCPNPISTGFDVAVRVSAFMTVAPIVTTPIFTINNIRWN